MTSGIYSITNLITGRRYIGSSVNITKRWIEHLRYLDTNKHHCGYLQNAWNKYGKSNFDFSILYECKPIKDVLLFYEQLWIDFEGCGNLYNTSPTAGNCLGVKHSQEAIKNFQMAQNKHYIIQIDLEGNILGEWNSIRDASRQLGIHSGNICQSVNKYVKCRNTMFVKSKEDIEFALQKNKEGCHNKRKAFIGAREDYIKGCSKSIYQINNDTNIIIKIWNSTSNASKETGISQSNISQCATKKVYRSAGGYVWRYVEDTNYQIGDIYPF